MFRKSVSLNDWRDYFRRSKSDIFETIEVAIMVAASDCPQEFRVRRDRIAEILFSCKLARCVGCDRVELSVGGDEDGGGCKGESKGNSSRVDQTAEMNVNQVISHYNYEGDAEALTDEIEEESQILSEVLRIKKIFDNYQDEPDTVILDSLRRLQLMSLAVNVLRSTEIGKAVNDLRKSESKQIRHLACALVEGWKEMLDEWADTAALLSDATPESANPSALEDDDGLDFPPLDEAALLAAQTSVELSQFFDGMDDDGNPQNSREFNQNLDSSRKPSTITSQGSAQNHKQQLDEAAHEPYIPAEITHEPYIPAMVNMDSEPDYFMKNHMTPVMQSHKPKSGPAGPAKASIDRNVSNGNGTKFQKKPFEPKQKKQPMVSPQDHCQSNNSPVSASLEAAKRKLQERYQEAENVKRQRTIQVMELSELPKKKQQQPPLQRHKVMGHKNAAQQIRPGNGNSSSSSRHWANGRR